MSSKNLFDNTVTENKMIEQNLDFRNHLQEMKATSVRRQTMVCHHKATVLSDAVVARLSPEKEMNMQIRTKFGETYVHTKTTKKREEKKKIKGKMEDEVKRDVIG